jgi:uncharacterized membrane protein SpoIIM required for sporulation
MLESIINPKRAERRPWEMFIIGFVYASLSIFLVRFVFSGDAVLSKYSGIFMITFCVIFSMPFFYYLIKLEEEKNIKYEGSFCIMLEHSKALFALLWLFLGFIIAFSIWYSVLPGGADNFRAQIETFCYINSPSDYQGCVNSYLGGAVSGTGQIIGNATSAASARFLAIFVNNIYVMIFTLIFSLIFGAGAIFILAWNASVIAAAIGIFTKGQVANLGSGLLRYMIHGIPEIAAYFIAALGGGILSIAIIKRDTNSQNFWKIFQDALYLVILAIIVLIIAAAIEVFITPALF